jgi:hypothetical protein
VDEDDQAALDPEPLGPAEDRTGEELDHNDRLLDRRVFYLCYHKNKSATYPKGFYGYVVGRVLIPDGRGPLRWGIVPLAHYKCMEDLADALGLALVDLLKDGQLLLNFVHGQILRYTQWMRGKVLVPMQSLVKRSDVEGPSTMISYNKNAGAPEVMQIPQMPAALPEVLRIFERGFDNDAAESDVTRGVQVPNVRSGDQVESLRSGALTVLHLTRIPMVEGIEQEGRIILKATQREWTLPRQVRYLGRDRDYVREAFAGTDFETVDDVRLAEGSLLMITPEQRAQRLEYYHQAQVIDGTTLRRNLPLADTAGVSLSQDKHYMRARRQVKRFLKGPPPALLAAYDRFAAEAGLLEAELGKLEAEAQAAAAVAQADPAGVEVTPAAGEDLEALRAQLDRLTAGWEAELARHLPTRMGFEDAADIAAVRYEEFSRALASERAEALPGWWRDGLDRLAVREGQVAGRIPPPAPVVPTAGAGIPPESSAPTAPAPPAEPAAAAA